MGEALTAMPAARLVKPLRGQRDVRWSPPTSPAGQALASAGAWNAAWDRATGVPNRLWGAGIPAPGTVASADAAAAFARTWLARNIALIAPGAAPADFELVSNRLDDGLRAVGFIQRHAGRIVVGGQVSFQFKADRLFVIGSEALPNVALPPQLQAQLPRAELAGRAARAARTALALAADAPATAPGDEVVLPLVGDDAVLGYRLAVPVTVDGGAAGNYLAYSDPTTGEILAARQLNMYATGTLLYRAVDRHPGRDRIDRPAPAAFITLNGKQQTTSASGQVTWADDSQQMLTTSVIGSLVRVINKASSGAASTQIALSPGGEIVWDASASVEQDAQVQTYLNTNIAKNYAAKLDPEMSGLTEQIVANVNINQDCNAFFDGKTINFFHASSECQNTGLLPDVVFHEYGHAVHVAQIIMGVGAFDGAMSEGAADFFAVQITGDPGMGRGFFFNDTALRDLDPPMLENRWPEDIGEIHRTGIIFGGTFWDLRVQLIAELGETEGMKTVEKLFVGALRRSTSIPTSLIEVLATDDDDGNLANGTPHECAIRNAYARHGLRTASGTVAAPAQLDQPTRATTVHVELTSLALQCPSEQIDRTELVWKPSITGTGFTAGTTTATKAAATTYYAELPLASDAKVLYQVRVVFTDGSALVLPDNRADPFYEVYEGRTMPLYCFDFEAGNPLEAGWTTGTGDGTASPWVWGTPQSGTSDPHAAFSGSHVLAQVLDGNYPAKASSFVKMPTIDVGQWSDVRLQYRRWLTVEDSRYDKARILVGGAPVWVNYTENRGDSSSAHHLDREWRFHDVSVSGVQPGHKLDISWDLSSDEGLHFGGWTLDDVCVVANLSSVCGDGVVTARETCDDGGANADIPNACRTWCQAPACGDLIIDDDEQCDGGPIGDITCTAKCELIEAPELGGCCSTDRRASGSFVLGGLVLGFVLRRRRRR